MIKPDYIFSTSWEVCNKVGGIYTVLSTQAKTLSETFPDKIFYIGPDLSKGRQNPLFTPDASLHRPWVKKAQEAGIPVRMGRWNIPGKPIVMLVSYDGLQNELNEAKGKMWEDFHVDSLHAYGDYDESFLFSLAAGKLVECIYSHFMNEDAKVVYQAHEWMSGFGLLYVKKHLPKIGTIFTTHATSIGRSITTNEKPLYDYFEYYYGDQMAEELHMEAKHSIEKQAALNADVLSTVSLATDRECMQFLNRKSDVILENGFEMEFVPKAAEYNKKRKEARKRMTEVCNQLTGSKLDPEKTLILSTSGRNDFRCKGFDLFINTVKRLQTFYNGEDDILAVIAVPCWKKGAREDLKKGQKGSYFDKLSNQGLPAFITHELYNMDEDRIVATIRHFGISTEPSCKVHLLFIPSYLDGKDGILNLDYYEWLTGSDLCLYPSYYEPWGYTCLESISFGIPCITTDLTGFGQWVNAELGKWSELRDGVGVIHRTDSNWEDAAERMTSMVREYANFTPEERRQAGKNATQMAKKAQWRYFIKNYYKAFDKALTDK